MPYDTSGRRSCVKQGIINFTIGLINGSAFHLSLNATQNFGAGGGIMELVRYWLCGTIGYGSAVLVDGVLSEDGRSGTVMATETLAGGFVEGALYWGGHKIFPGYNPAFFGHNAMYGSIFYGLSKSMVDDYVANQSKP